MNDNKVLEIKVGITILIAIVLLVMSIVWLKGITFKPNTYGVDILFNNTAGLQIGDPVTVSGMKVGKVTDITLEGDSVIVAVSLSNSVIMKEDVKAVITSVDFFGGKKIELIPGQSNKFLGHNRMNGTREPDLTELTSQLKEIASDVKSTLQRMDSVLIGVNSFVGDKTVISSLKHAIYNLDSTTNKVRMIVDKSDLKIDTALTKLVTATRNFKSILERADTRLDTAFGNVNQITGTVLGITESLDSIVSKVKRGEGNLGKMIYEEDIYDKLSRTASQLDSLISVVNQKGMKVNVKLFGD